MTALWRTVHAPSFLGDEEHERDVTVTARYRQPERRYAPAAYYTTPPDPGDVEYLWILGDDDGREWDFDDLPESDRLRIEQAVEEAVMEDNRW